MSKVSLQQVQSSIYWCFSNFNVVSRCVLYVSMPSAVNYCLTKAIDNTYSEIVACYVEDEFLSCMNKRFSTPFPVKPKSVYPSTLNFERLITRCDVQIYQIYGWNSSASGLSAHAWNIRHALVTFLLIILVIFLPSSGIQVEGLNRFWSLYLDWRGLTQRSVF